ncbi:MAG: replication initiation protein [Carnobacterium sp.]|nr:replication initiation protein [Carnobacterium sp.]
MTLNIWKNDRNFEVEKHKEQLQYYVVEHNDLISKARQDLTARELKIMDFVISKIKPSDTNFTKVNTSMYELSNVLDLKRNGKNYSDLARNIGDLRKKEVLIYNKDRKSVTQTGWVSEATYEENGQVEILLSSKLAPYLLDLKDNYTQYLLHDTVQLKSKYSILLYKLIREADKDRGKNIVILQGTPDDFMEWLGAPNSYDYGKLKDKILTKAIEEINLKIDDMDLELLQARRGRKVVLVEIHNNFIKQNNLINKNIRKVPMHDWTK